ncbi:MAG: hypothetical protein M3Y67_04225 [Pseudomonadota bacterium]|nr:hypothetical protein [Pseudomonadota bacterium]
MKKLRAFAAEGPVPLFVAVGQGWAAAVEDLCLSSAIARAATPRHASILLVAGDVRPTDREALRLLHDQMPHPRATLWWGSTSSDHTGVAAALNADDDPLPLLRSLYRRLLLGELASEDHLLPDGPPAPWRGRGEHGQGGDGMMGGTPYGRPMAMTDDDLRDGLALDACTVEVGPFLPALPPGLVLEIELQGDVIQRARVIQSAYPPSSIGSAGAAAHLAVPGVAHRLRCIAAVLSLQQLPAQAELCRRLAMDIARCTAMRLPDLRRILQCAGAFAAIPPELGRIEPALASSLGAIGLTARDRMHRWVDEVELAAQVAQPPAPARGATAPNSGTSRALTHEPIQDGRLPFLFTDLLTGLEWGEALLVIASFDASALWRMSPTADAAALPDSHREHAMAHGR